MTKNTRAISTSAQKLGIVVNTDILAPNTKAVIIREKKHLCQNYLSVPGDD